MLKFLYLLVFASLFYQCQGNAQESAESESKISLQDTVSSLELTIEPEPIDTFFDRTAIKAALAAKIDQGLPLIVHAYIPLCDNEHQGIVPTTASLGNGMSLKSNLYWATSGGTKAYFKKQPEWKLIFSELDIDSNVLERVIFERNYANTKVYFVADAYRGDRMEATVNDYLAAISGNRPQLVKFDDQSVLHVADAADLVMFNGHNGVMDYIQIKPWINLTEKRTDIVMNACVSYGYLQEEFMLAGGYPLVRTNTLLYPGAYVLEQIIDDWVAGIDATTLCLNAGKVYCDKHDCGQGTKVYKSGW